MITDIRIYPFLLLFILSVLIAACATMPKTGETKKPAVIKPKFPSETKPAEKPARAKPEKTEPEETKPDDVKPPEIKPPVEARELLVPTEQETKSLELFAEILEIAESSQDRRSALPRIEGLYTKIIREYPDAPLAQESYWKLITIYVQDYSPPAYEKAEAYYHEFLEKYPQSFVKNFIEDTLGNSYYKRAEWDRLLKLSEPAYLQYMKGGKHPSASLIFMYSEANYNLGNFEEAEHGYKIVSELFPKLIVGIRSKAMLKKIREEKY